MSQEHSNNLSKQLEEEKNKLENLKKIENLSEISLENSKSFITWSAQVKVKRDQLLSEIKNSFNSFSF